MFASFDSSSNKLVCMILDFQAKIKRISAVYIYSHFSRLSSLLSSVSLPQTHPSNHANRIFLALPIGLDQV
jgi:hypothetical protein